MKGNLKVLDENYQYKCHFCLFLNSPNTFALEQLQSGNIIIHTCKKCNSTSEIKYSFLKRQS